MVLMNHVQVSLITYKFNHPCLTCERIQGSFWNL